MSEVAARAISTYETYLMYKTSSAGSYSKLVDITSFPDLIGTPERIDITSLSDSQRVYIAGIQDRDEMTFNANYTSANYTAVHDCEGHEYYYAVYFGSTGADGKFEWVGDIRAGVAGGGVNEAVQMTVTCTPSTEITFTSGT